jgi:hypothetical protein
MEVQAIAKLIKNRSGWKFHPGKNCHVVGVKESAAMLSYAFSSEFHSSVHFIKKIAWFRRQFTFTMFLNIED